MATDRTLVLINQMSASMQNLKPCPFRHVGEEGHILCDKIKTGNKEVSPNICRECPISAINCSHLRATLDHSSRPPITVRYGNGRTEIWDDVGGDPIKLERAACASKVMPIHSARDCAGCALRQALVSAESVNAIVPQAVPNVIERRKTRNAPLPTAIASNQPTTSSIVPSTPTAEKRENIVAQKIIKLQDWIAQQSKAKREADDDETEVRPIAVSQQRVVHTSTEEKRVGWTD